MKIAEALILRADCQRRVAELKNRIVTNALVQEGEAPAEDPQTLIEEHERVAADLLLLVQLINATNSATTVEDGQTMTNALALRDSLRLRHKMFEALATTAASRGDRYSRAEIKSVPTIAVSAIRPRMDAIAREFRALDTKIQGLNWQIDLIEPTENVQQASLRRLTERSVATPRALPNESGAFDGSDAFADE